jgi:hypothetical protein
MPNLLDQVDKLRPEERALFVATTFARVVVLLILAAGVTTLAFTAPRLVASDAETLRAGSATAPASFDEASHAREPAASRRFLVPRG